MPRPYNHFKSVTARRINEIRHSPGATIWQRNYNEHIIRDERDLNRVREYIKLNPERWEFDRENPHRRSGSNDWSVEEDRWFEQAIGSMSMIVH